MPRLCAKLPAATLEAALSTAGVGGLAKAPEDAAVVPTKAQGSGGMLLQSVDGFPALISDPWLNGRLTALHAFSDLWASGADAVGSGGDHFAPDLAKHPATAVSPNHRWHPLGARSPASGSDWWAHP